MKVKLYGFEVESSSSSITIDALMASMEKKSGLPDNSRNIERRIFIDCSSHAEYHSGLVVTVKDQKRFCRLEGSGGQIKIAVENLKGDDKLMEFNFFVLNKKNGIGLYQHYHNSCGLNIFGAYLSSEFTNLRQSLIDVESEALELANGSISESQKKEIRRKFKSKLIFSQLVRKESLEKILGEYKKLKAFEYEFSAIDSKVREGIPLSNYAKKIREKLTFASGWGVPILSSAISEAIDKIKPSTGRIYATNQEGDDVSIRVFNIPDNFGEEDFDDVALKLNNLDLQTFSSHKVSLDLIAVCKSKDYRHIFEANVK